MSTYDILDDDQLARVLGRVRSHDVEYPLFSVEVTGDWEPDGLCFFPTTDGRELSALRDYTHPDWHRYIWVRLIDEDVRGWTEDEVLDLLWGDDFDEALPVLAPGE